MSLIEFWNVVLYPLLVGAGALTVCLVIAAFMAWALGAVGDKVSGRTPEVPEAIQRILMVGVVLLFVWFVGMLLTTE